MTQTSFKDVANVYYQQEINKIIFEQSGQGRLIFVSNDLFQSFKDIETVPAEALDDIKIAIVKGLGRAIEKEIEEYLSDRYCVTSKDKMGSQFFNGQLNKKNANVSLWVEVNVFYDLSGIKTQFTYKHNFSNNLVYTEEVVAQLIKKLKKSINKTFIEKEIPKGAC